MVGARLFVLSIAQMVLREFDRKGYFNFRRFLAKRLMKLLSLVWLCAGLLGICYGIVHPEIFPFLVSQMIFLYVTAIRKQVWQDPDRYFLQSVGVALILMYSQVPAKGRITYLLEKVWRLGSVQTIGRASLSVFLALMPAMIAVSYLFPLWFHIGSEAQVVAKAIVGVSWGHLVWIFMEFFYSE